MCLLYKGDGYHHYQLRSQQVAWFAGKLQSMKREDGLAKVPVQSLTSLQENVVTSCAGATGEAPKVSHFQWHLQVLPTVTCFLVARQIRDFQITA